MDIGKGWKVENTVFILRQMARKEFYGNERASKWTTCIAEQSAKGVGDRIYDGEVRAVSTFHTEVELLNDTEHDVVSTDIPTIPTTGVHLRDSNADNVVVASTGMCDAVVPARKYGFDYRAIVNEYMSRKPLQGEMSLSNII